MFLIFSSPPFQYNCLALIRSTVLTAKVRMLHWTPILAKLNDVLLLISYMSFNIKCHFMSNDTYEITNMIQFYIIYCFYVTFYIHRGLPLGLHIGADVAKSQLRPEILLDLFQIWIKILDFRYHFGINAKQKYKFSFRYLISTVRKH